MSDEVSLSSEDRELLSAVVRKRQPSFLWIVAAMKERPLQPAQRDTLKHMLTDEMREAGSGSERGLALQGLLGRLG
jgi:hypothetical protein